MLAWMRHRRGKGLEELREQKIDRWECAVDEGADSAEPDGGSKDLALTPEKNATSLHAHEDMEKAEQNLNARVGSECSSDVFNREHKRLEPTYHSAMYDVSKHFMGHRRVTYKCCKQARNMAIWMTGNNLSRLHTNSVNNVRQHQIRVVQFVYYRP